MFVPFGVGRIIDMIGEQLKTTNEMNKEHTQNQLNKYFATILLIFIIGGACNAGRIYLMSVAGMWLSYSVSYSQFRGKSCIVIF